MSHGRRVQQQRLGSAMRRRAQGVDAVAQRRPNSPRKALPWRQHPASQPPHLVQQPQAGAQRQHKAPGVKRAPPAGIVVLCPGILVVSWQLAVICEGLLGSGRAGGWDVLAELRAIWRPEPGHAPPQEAGAAQRSPWLLHSGPLPALQSISPAAGGAQAPAWLTLLKSCHHHRALEGCPRSCRALHHGCRRHPLTVHHRTAAAAACRGGPVAADADAHPPAAGGSGRHAAGWLSRGLALPCLESLLLRLPLRRPAILHGHKVIPQAAIARQHAAAAAAAAAVLRRRSLCQPSRIVTGRQGPHRRLSGPSHGCRRRQAHRPGGPRERPAGRAQGCNSKMKPGAGRREPQLGSCSAGGGDSGGGRVHWSETRLCATPLLCCIARVFMPPPWRCRRRADPAEPRAPARAVCGP